MICQRILKRVFLTPVSRSLFLTVDLHWEFGKGFTYVNLGEMEEEEIWFLRHSDSKVELLCRLSVDFTFDIKASLGSWEGNNFVPDP